MLKAQDYLDPQTPIFTWVRDDGLNINIHIGLLWRWTQDALQRGEVVITLIPIERAQSRRYIASNTVSRARVKQLFRREEAGETLGPMIFGDRGTRTDGLIDVMHIDGHHRYVLWSAKRLPFGPGVLLRPDQWRPFQLEGLPDISQAA